MAVEGKTILQTTERTELTGKEGIPFQEGTQNGHVLLEKIKEYISSDVYICPGAFQTTEGWSTTDVESIVGNWDEFTKAVSGGKIIVGYFQNEGQFVKSTASVIENDGVTFLSFSFYQLLCVYIIDQSYITIVTIDNFLCVSSVVDRLNSSGTELPLSANQGRILNEKIAEISNPVSAEKDGLMSKEDKEAFDNMKDGGAIEYKEISGQTVDADDLIVPKLTVRYLNKNASTAENISNIPAKGGFVLESMCVRYVDEDNCGYIQEVD